LSSSSSPNQLCVGQKWTPGLVLPSTWSSSHALNSMIILSPEISESSFSCSNRQPEQQKSEWIRRRRWREMT
jgi:hypothetical protein